jgi:hypothetical protein
MKLLNAACRMPRTWTARHTITAGIDMAEIRNTQQKVDTKKYGENFDRIFKSECKHDYALVPAKLTGGKTVYECLHCGKRK